MNERIRQLAEQAGFYYTDKTGFITPAGCDPAKFAELIVKECSKVIVNGGYRNPALGEKHPLSPPEIAQMIEDHFGVEE
jgi:hypothetical protein